MKTLCVSLILGIASCPACKSAESDGKPYSVPVADSVLLQKINELEQETAQLKANFETLIQDLYVDSMKQKEIKLSRGYSVLFYPQREYHNGVLSIYTTYWLRGEAGEWPLKDGDAWYRDEIVDMNDFFFMFGVQGKPIEFFLYEKRTGSLCLHASALKLNREQEAFVYFNYPEGDYKYYIYDIKTRVKTLLQLPDPERYPWVMYNNAYESVFIKDVRNGYYVLGSTEDDACEFMIPVSEEE
jgi:hypothetical protein